MQCEEKGCQEQAENRLSSMVNGEYSSKSYCLRHYYEQHYRIYKKCNVTECSSKVFKQFLTPPESPYAPALGPYLCYDHFNDLKSKCLYADCEKPATVEREIKIKGQKVNYYLCENHVDDQETSQF